MLKRTPFARKVPDLALKPAKGPKLKSCKVCREKFAPISPWAKACTPECAQKLIEQVKQAQERKQDRERKQALKTRRDWMAEAQAALNKWVREVRDAGKPCISCGRHHQSQNHAGHYLSRGAHANLALVENNIALQCAPCNVHLSGNQIYFRQGLIERIGRDAVEALESDQTPRKHTIEELKEIRDRYRKKLREMKGQK